MAEVVARPAPRAAGIRWGRVGAWIAAVVVSGSVAFTGLHRWEAVRDREQGLLSVPPANLTKILASGYENMVADIFYMQFTTYWGYWLTHGRKFHNLYPLLDLVTELDHDFRSAYEVGALALADAGDLNRAVDLLLKGAHYHPKDHWYPYQAGLMLFLYGNDYLLAAKYFEMASRIPGAPPDAAYFSARMYAEKGQKELARKRWLQIYIEASRSSDKARLEVAGRALKRFKLDGDDLDFIEIYATHPDLEAKKLAAFALRKRGIDVLDVDPTR